MSEQKNAISNTKYPRRHHFIPKFYLSGFTLSGEEDDYLCVLDMDSAKQWKDKPRNLAYQRDFYRVELPGVKPDIIESAFSNIESQASQVIRNIVKSEALPAKETEDFIILINFVALITARVPRVRSVFSVPLEEISKFALRLMLATPERWESTTAKMKQNGYEIDDKIAYEQMKNFIERDDYRIEVNKMWHIKNVLDIVDILIPLLMARNWSLLIVKPEDAFFICSDSPESLMWTKPMPAFWDPGFGLPDTELVMPLNKKQALIASFEGESKTYPVPLEVIAKVNNRTRMSSNRFIYSAKEDFVWTKKDGKIGNTSDLIQEIKSRMQEK